MSVAWFVTVILGALNFLQYHEDLLRFLVISRKPGSPPLLPLWASTCCLGMKVKVTLWGKI